MAEACSVAFGRYLRMLRERRGLSLDDVASLSRTLADPVVKGHLSRCENGHHGPGFSKIVTLSRLYDVPIEILAEKLELDFELDRIGGPVTEGRSFEELHRLAMAAYEKGERWNLYAFARDAVSLAADAPLMAGFERREEQMLCALMNLSTAAANLGRSRFALFELEHIHATGQLRGHYHQVLLERMALRCRDRGDLARAAALCREAIEGAERSDNVRYAGYLYSTAASLSLEQAKFGDAIDLCQKAFAAFRKSNRNTECARAMLNLANAYFEAGHDAGAQQALAAFERMVDSERQIRLRALSLVLRGELEERGGRYARACAHWREALESAKRLKDKILQFKAELPLYRVALATGDTQSASSLARRLRRLTPWVPHGIEEYAEFRRLESTGTPPPR